MQISQHYNLKVSHFIFKNKTQDRRKFYHELFFWFSQMEISAQKMRDKVFFYIFGVSYLFLVCFLITHGIVNTLAYFI